MFWCVSVVRVMCCARAHSNNKFEVAKWLVERGAGVHLSVPDDRGYKPMHYACEKCNLEMIKWLVSLGAEKDLLEGTNTRRLRAIQYAYVKGSTKILEWAYHQSEELRTYLTSVLCPRYYLQVCCVRERACSEMHEAAGSPIISSERLSFMSLSSF